MWTRIQTTIYFGYDKFFRVKILTSDSEQILQYIEELEKDSKKIKEEALKFTWHMRGGLSYNEAMSLSYSEREIISNIIKENIETTKKTGLNYF